MRRFFRVLFGLLYVSVAVALGAVFAATGILIWLRSEDPMALARAPVPPYHASEVARGVVEKDGAQRIYTDYRLASPGRPPVLFTVSLPADAAQGPMPVLLIVGGLRSGRENLERLPSLGANALISFEYPHRDIIRDKTRGAPERLLHVYRSSRATAEQLAAIIRWTGAEQWADAGRIALLGYSLGAMVAPVVHVKAKASGIHHGVTILAFGGADLGAIAPRVLKLKSPVLEAPAAWIAGALLNAVEPAHFLPAIESQVLIIHAARDELIPPASQQLLERLTPDPKWVVTMPGEHIDPRDPAVLLAVVAETTRWLVARGAVVVPR
ncbi:MAG: alpha/beta hydrolase family protein [Alphaproteobacteria bacterium]